MDVHAVDEVILGQVLTAGAGQNPARQSAINGGLPNTVSAITINDVCGSGLKALHLATQLSSAAKPTLSLRADKRI